MVAEAVTVGSVAEAAVSVTVRVATDEVAGGVYVVLPPLTVDVGETLPQGAGEHERVQLTPLFAESLVTVAANWPVVPTPNVAVVLESDTLMAGPTGFAGVGVPPPQPKFKTVKAPAMNAAITDALFLPTITDLRVHPFHYSCLILRALGFRVAVALVGHPLVVHPASESAEAHSPLQHLADVLGQNRSRPCNSG